MTTCTDLLLAGWRQNLEQTQTLLATIPAARMTEQPTGAANHPAWTLAHLMHYHPAIISLIRGDAVDDPGLQPDAARYDAGSTPTDDPSAFPSKDTLLSRYREGHERAAYALRNAPSERLEHPPGLARWATGFDTSLHALSYLMLTHEAYHIGQLMSWRRAAGLGLAVE